MRQVVAAQRRPIGHARFIRERAQQLREEGACVLQESAVRLQLVIAALAVIVPQRKQNWPARSNSRELCGHEPHRFSRKAAEGFGIVVLGCPLEFLAKMMNQNVARDHHEPCIRSSLFDGFERGREQRPVRILPKCETLAGDADSRRRGHLSTLDSAKASTNSPLAVGSKCKSESQMNSECGLAAAPMCPSSTSAAKLATQDIARLLIFFIKQFPGKMICSRWPRERLSLGQ